MSGIKNDSLKVRMDLLPPEALIEIAKVFTFGASKYGDHNWRGGLNYSRLYAACQRHLNAFWSNEDTDPESGVTHLAHAICNIMMIMCMDPKINDDRYKEEQWHSVL